MLQITKNVTLFPCARVSVTLFGHMLCIFNYISYWQITLQVLFLVTSQQVFESSVYPTLSPTLGIIWLLLLTDGCEILFHFCWLLERRIFLHYLLAIVISDFAKILVNWLLSFYCRFIYSLFREFHNIVW